MNNEAYTKTEGQNVAVYLNDIRIASYNKLEDDDAYTNADKTTNAVNCIIKGHFPESNRAVLSKSILEKLDQIIQKEKGKIMIKENLFKKNIYEKLDVVIKHCLLLKDEAEDYIKNPDNKNYIKCEAVNATYVFSEERVEELKQQILEIDESIGDKGRKTQGVSFMELTQDKQGNPIEHPTVDSYLALCFAINIAKFLAPRSIWPMLPYGVPYIEFNYGETNEAN